MNPPVTILALVFAFGAGYYSRQLPSSPVYAFSPAGCSRLGLKATGWEVQSMYGGGINQGGISSPILVECGAQP